MDRVAARFAVHQKGLLIRSQAHEAGLSDEAIDHRIETGRWGRMHAGVYRVAGTQPGFEQGLLAACFAAGPEAVASHRGAGAVWGFDAVEQAIELTVPRPLNPRVRGAMIHRVTALPREDITVHSDTPITTVARTVIDLAGIFRPPRLEVVYDDALVKRLTTTRELQERLDALGRCGRRGVATIAALLDEPANWSRARSRTERRFLRLLRAHGLPLPIPNYEIRLPNGETAFLDAAYPDLLLAIEASSFRWHATRRDWARNETRNSRLGAMGWRFIYVVPEDIDRQPPVVVDLVRQGLAHLSV